MHDMQAAPEPAVRRNVLLLQGNAGPFFRRIGAALRRDGYGVYKVNFNGGDWLFWNQPGGIAYTGTLADWPAGLARIITGFEITDVLLFGDCRPIHLAATALCRELHIATHVFEEGYIRPDWVTFELGGVNGHSQLSRDPEYYLEAARHLPPAPMHGPVQSSFRRRAVEAIAYETANILLAWRFPHWRTHRPWHPLVEAMHWLPRLAGRGAAARRSAAFLRRWVGEKEESGRFFEKKLRKKRLLRKSLPFQTPLPPGQKFFAELFFKKATASLPPASPFFLFPLQLDSDTQIRVHSRFAGMAEAIGLVIASFARHAPKDHMLVIKEHPLDNGMSDWRALARECAAAHGITGRVIYLESGDIAIAVPAARGLVTINSTTGTLALARGVPVITLGQAVYDLPGVTFQGRLSDFWADPGVPDARIFDAFRRVLIETCLIPGGFLSNQALTLLTASAVARLEAHSPVNFAAVSRATLPALLRGISAKAA